MKINKKLNTLIIIKTGETETFIEENVGIISLGDVFRTSVYLRLHNQFEEIIWLTSSEAVPLIKAKHVKVELLSDYNSRPSVLGHSIIINLERSEHVKQLFNNNWNSVIGFVFLRDNWYLKDYKNRLFLLEEWNADCAKNGIKTWGAKLLAIGGFSNEKLYGTMDVPIREKSNVIGINWMVGKKWPSKKIPRETWSQLVSELSKNYSVSWQEGENSLEDYINWILSCRLIITADSLGMHLAVAFNIPVVAIFGPTCSENLDVNEVTSILKFETPKHYNCMPCNKSECFQESHCSSFFPFENLIKEVGKLCKV
jgi:heptosyltransferase-2